jgi:hypothetical protein
MRSSVCPALTTAAIVHGLSTDHDRRRGQRCTVLTHPVSLIHRGIFVQMNRATSCLSRQAPSIFIWINKSSVWHPQKVQPLIAKFIRLN